MSFVETLSLSRMVPYWRFHCIHNKGEGGWWLGAHVEGDLLDTFLVDEVEHTYDLSLMRPGHYVGEDVGGCLGRELAPPLHRGSLGDGGVEREGRKIKEEREGKGP